MSLSMSPEENINVIDKMSNIASSCWLQISSEYQQDKLIPSCKYSPQPGPTYYMS